MKHDGGFRSGKYDSANAPARGICGRERADQPMAFDWGIRAAQLNSKGHAARIRDRLRNQSKHAAAQAVAEVLQRTKPRCPIGGVGMGKTI